MLVAPARFEDQAAAVDYIHRCENAFALRVGEIADSLLRCDGLRLIGLSGPTCAGKTTTGALLIDHLETNGKRVHQISVDDFFREQPHARASAQQKQSLDFDSIDALDFPLFSDFFDRLMTSGRAIMPRFDLSTGVRKGEQEIVARDERDVFLIEGIQVVYPEISELLHRYTYRSIFANVKAVLEVDGVRYQPEDIRLMRRMVRDYYFRSSDAAFTYFLWDSVRANEQKNIFPYMELCDFSMETLMGYEIGMLRPHLEIVLHQLPMSHGRRPDADALLDCISHVQPLHPSWLPENALYREFVPVT